MAGHDSEKDEWVHENEGAYIADESLIHNFLSTTEQREGVKAFIDQVNHGKTHVSNGFGAKFCAHLFLSCLVAGSIAMSSNKS